MMPVNIVLVDDHPLVLNGLEQLLATNPDFKVVAACSTGADGERAVRSLRPDVLVLDLKLPDADGVDVLRRLQGVPGLGVVILTGSQDEAEWLEGVRLGARAVVLKAMAPRALEDAIRAVCAGESRLIVGDADLGLRLDAREQGDARLRQLLTARELEVARCAASALDNQQIAAKLAIAVGTLKIHLHHVYEKLGVEGRDGLRRVLLEADKRATTDDFVITSPIAAVRGTR